MPQSVVIIAPEADVHAQVVAKRIETLGANPIILDSALFPSLWRLSVSKSNGMSLHFKLENDTISVGEDEITGVWWRRPRRHIPPDPVQELHLRRFVVDESREAFDGWLYCLDNKVINPVNADSVSHNKLLQLQLATEVGLQIPKTMATNSVEQMKSFYEDIGEGIVFKPFTGTTWQFSGTQRVTEDVIEHMNCIEYSPVILQEEIKKDIDVRVNIIDKQVFAITITGKHGDAMLDWRIDPDRDYAVHKLPQKVEDALTDLIGRLGLRFGACDLALTGSGEYVFFEVNPGWQWLFAEVMTGQELSMAFAKALLDSPERHPKSAIEADR